MEKGWPGKAVHHSSRGVCDSPSLIVYGNNFAIFPEGRGGGVCTQAWKGGLGEGYLFLRILEERRLNRKGGNFFNLHLDERNSK